MSPEALLGYPDPTPFVGPIDKEPFPMSFLDEDRPMNGQRMGLRLMRDDRWLMVDGTYTAQMRHKQEVLREDPDQLTATAS